MNAVCQFGPGGDPHGTHWETVMDRGKVGEVGRPLQGAPGSGVSGPTRSLSEHTEIDAPQHRAICRACDCRHRMMRNRFLLSLEKRTLRWVVSGRVGRGGR